MAEYTITKDNIESEVIKSDKPVLLDFWATWCGPCRMIAPVVEEIAEDYTGRLKVGKVNVDDEPELASAFKVASIPTLVLVKNGRIVTQSIGYRTKEELVKVIEANL